MPPESKKPIEELLEASAKARRDQFGVDTKMPNPMRSRLHEEIARQSRQEEPEPRSSWLTRWWPQMAVGTALAALLISLPVMWRSGSPSAESELRFATNQPAHANEMKEALTLAPPPSASGLQRAPAEMRHDPAKALSEGELSSSPSGLLADSNLGRSKSEEAARTDEVASGGEKASADMQVAPATQAPGADEFLAARRNNTQDPSGRSVDESSRLAKEADKREQGAASAAAPAAPVTRSQKMVATNFQQQFSQTSANQISRGTLKSKQAMNVLANFQVQQEGDQIRVVDEDGSTYTGKLELLAKKDSRNVAKRASSYATAPAARTARARPAQDLGASSDEFFFRATGFNGSLKKPVVFEGNYIVTQARQKTATQEKAPEMQERVPARIVGTAKIPGESPLPVDAVLVTK